MLKKFSGSALPTCLITYNLIVVGCIKKGKVDYRICYLLYVQSKKDGKKLNVEYNLVHHHKLNLTYYDFFVFVNKHVNEQVIEQEFNFIIHYVILVIDEIYTNISQS